MACREFGSQSDCTFHGKSSYRGGILKFLTEVQISCLDDNKATADANTLKSLALDHLGVITAKLRSSLVKAKQASQESSAPPLSPITKTWDEVWPVFLR